ncbi:MULTISPECIES: LysR family transcriptional regulator [Providencia]|uniref:LysR family transcriptional regulator n=1 Tax=Providencia stuartii TaxID=588 RepID=A0AAI9MVV9_PROST|nr:MULTISPECIES: LysR family transcriptional regulator [Providencia]ELR5034752.1 LysR family transcriptional regulator [Providencia stuartii]ELR5038003.1 LysR family transcriptional regulator [Providencia stuartii]MBG5920437.1 LysR family transcriptional regulator [Providencia stuartii]QIC14408.1 LysR family transcriptional regulator [Providencia vermicola]
MSGNYRHRLPLNALRAFEASARHLSFTRAGLELNVTQAAVSQQVRLLEEQLGLELFVRLPRGLALTDEGLALLPVLSRSFDQIESLLQQFEDGHYHEVLSVSVVGTFAVGWLLPRLPAFTELYPYIDLRIMTHNNVVNLAAEGVDFAIRFGEGLWPLAENTPLFPAAHTVLCSEKIAHKLTHPLDLKEHRLMRSYRKDEWEKWQIVAGLEPWRVKGPIFDSSRLMVEAALLTDSVALAPSCMFEHELSAGTLVQPFDLSVTLGGYWLSRLKSRPITPAMVIFQNWLLTEVKS